jgi:phage-related protein
MVWSNHDPKHLYFILDLQYKIFNIFISKSHPKDISNPGSKGKVKFKNLYF